MDDFKENLKKKGVGRVFSAKAALIGFIFVVFVVVLFLYQRGDVGLFSQSDKESVVEMKTAEMFFTDPEYRLSYHDKINESLIISNFEVGEAWYGDGEIDYRTVLEGNNSLFLASRDNKKSTVSITKKFDFSQAKSFKLLAYLETDPKDIESFDLIFAGTAGEYRYSIRDLETGWNFLSLPKERFSFSGSGKIDEESEGGSALLIGRVRIELVSRPKSNSAVNLGSLWLEKNDDYLLDWNCETEHFFSLKKSPWGNLAVITFTGGLATIKKVRSAEDFVFQAKFTPVREGVFGLFLRGDSVSGYGYSLILDGVGLSTWRIYKAAVREGKSETTTLENGRVNNFKVEPGQSYWLKGETRGEVITFSLSLDGIKFTQLARTRDDSFSSGAVGIVASGSNMFWVDDFLFSQ
ncbi:MAG: hypothetical protein JW991_04215 [Candidatus Pacebacteria bacterium]|nr:hypothetical protein [Candidatus Paceibacterota bacterium]